ncbi:MAG TPA: hypothetical protein PLR32_03430 [candidate division Zixibacteria bacterium]|nr:hypothetical protein [candidate division Zixibacteria bacterium]MDM7973354.1 hypothetical protein [candidate division Zixibacteria bacterium]HOD67087.1 hypothetical protein [candidate division Zixibacteria bacterium]HOZ08733.1 hypothetical protein [candidate division Zixibacteria bacterium]HPI32343.1 hypothetical protein [candidate division Zixibacteria bacterium]
MIYLVDPANANRPPCFAKCKVLCDGKGCTTYCGIKPLYGIDPTI